MNAESTSTPTNASVGIVFAPFPAASKQNTTNHHYHEDSNMLSYVSVGVDVLASLALLVSFFFLLKELRLTRDFLRHSDFVNSINQSAENILRITEN